MKVSESTNIAMPIKNLVSIIGAVAVGVWAYFGITEKLNNHATQLELMQKDLDKAVEFSIKWPRGEMGSLPADAEQFLLIEDAIKDNNLVEVADALTDILYVTYGAGHSFGIDLDACFDEVQSSNMSKLDENGKPIYNENGKVLKGPKYFAPNLKKYIE